MTYRSNLGWLLTFGFILPLSNVAAQPEKHWVCGGAGIEVINGREVSKPEFLLMLTRGDQRLKVAFSVERELLSVRCEPRDGGEVVLVNHQCGGSGCADGNFGIIDPQRMKVLLTPDAPFAGNAERAESILGHKIRSFSCRRPSAATYDWRSNGEYCHVSPIELG